MQNCHRDKLNINYAVTKKDLVDIINKKVKLCKSELKESEEKRKWAIFNQLNGSTWIMNG